MKLNVPCASMDRESSRKEFDITMEEGRRLATLSGFQGATLSATMGPFYMDIYWLTRPGRNQARVPYTIRNPRLTRGQVLKHIGRQV